MRGKTKGVTHSESYFSRQYSFSLFHIENKNLVTANYILKGEPKFLTG